MPAAAVHALGYDVLYYLCVSVGLSERSGGIDCALWEGLVAGDYGLSRRPTIDLGECEVSLVQMDGLWLHEACYGGLHRIYGLGFDGYGSLEDDTESDASVFNSNNYYILN